MGFVWFFVMTGSAIDDVKVFYFASFNEAIFDSTAGVCVSLSCVFLILLTYVMILLLYI